jgi:hypothetical protein
MKNPMYAFLAFVLRRLLKKPSVFGLERIHAPGTAIFVSNHEGIFAPLVLMLFANQDFVPWVVYENLDVRLCRGYLRRDFVEPVLRLRPPLSRLVSAMISPFCVGIMKYVDAIPVFHSSKRIVETMELSVETLKQGRNLLIFPENPRDEGGEDLKSFLTGFVHLAKECYEQNRQTVGFVPVFVDRKSNEIHFGAHIPFDPQAPYHQERVRILAALRQGMIALGADVPSQKADDKERL